MNEILSNKRALEEFETIKLIEESRAISQNMLPSKLEDPKSFTILCLIGEEKVKFDVLKTTKYPKEDDCFFQVDAPLNSPSSFNFYPS